jgi:hypothetical protein
MHFSPVYFLYSCLLYIRQMWQLLLRGCNEMGQSEEDFITLSALSSADSVA